jgi:hypothetical protein
LPSGSLEQQAQYTVQRSRSPWPPSQAFIGRCRSGQTTGLPLPGWRQNRVHSETSYSTVVPSLVCRTVTRRPQVGQARESRPMTVGIHASCRAGCACAAEAPKN